MLLDLKLLQKNPEIVSTALIHRGSPLNITSFEELDTKRRELLSEVETLKAKRNQASIQVAQMKRNGENTDTIIAELSELSSKIVVLDNMTNQVKTELYDWMLAVPNIPHYSVPIGKDETDNKEIYRWGEIPTFNFQPKEHWELGSTLQGLDFERASKITGSRFTILWKWAARLERSLINFFLDFHLAQGRTEVLPPLIVNEKSMTNTGQLPKFADDLFKLEGTDYFLIPTAEVPLTNIHSDEIIDEYLLPLSYCAQTACFRSEAGSAGKDTKGLIRQHQFTKVEMVYFSHPDQSYDLLEQMRRSAETLLEQLELPYRTVVLCTGDLGFSSSKTYDIEVWLPGQNTYREISSCSNCESFQARRANIRFRASSGEKTQFVHTLNGSGLPIGRTIVAILENGQQKDGSVQLPKKLVPYMGGIECIEP